MTILPIDDIPNLDLLEIPVEDQHPSPRQVWVQRRRIMEDQKAQFGPDGARSLWRSRIFSLGLRVFDRSARLVQLHDRGRRNALDVQLVARLISFPDLPPSFDGPTGESPL
jgi:hypothetical protein